MPLTGDRIIDHWTHILNLESRAARKDRMSGQTPYPGADQRSDNSKRARRPLALPKAPRPEKTMYLWKEIR
jgi:hypothetical protein